MARRKANFYVVWSGRNVGVFDTWAACESSVKGYPGALFKGYRTRQEAARAFADEAARHLGAGAPDHAPKRTPPRQDADAPKRRQDAGAPKQAPRRHDTAARGDGDGRPAVGLCVDAACNGAGGEVEYRGVLLPDGAQQFHVGPLPRGTNNIGEFLAIVHGLAQLDKTGSALPIYTDSRVAMKWVRDKQSRSRWIEDGRAGAELTALVRRAEIWLREHEVETRVRKWETRAWGEIPADFGRK